MARSYAWTAIQPMRPSGKPLGKSWPLPVFETDSEIGYVVIDADLDGPDCRELLDDIRGLDGTISARLIYQH